MMSQACARNDPLGRNVSWLLWRVPLMVFVVGLFLETVPRTLLWTPAFLVAGTACLLEEGDLSALPEVSIASDQIRYVAWITLRTPPPASSGLYLPTWPA